MLSTVSSTSRDLKRRLVTAILSLAMMSAFLFTGTPPASAHKSCNTSGHWHVARYWFVDGTVFVPPSWVDYHWYSADIILIDQGWIRCTT